MPHTQRQSIKLEFEPICQSREKVTKHVYNKTYCKDGYEYKRSI